MGTDKMVTAAAVFATLACVASASQVAAVTHLEEGRDKKMDKMMKDMYMAFMLAKNMMGMMLMFVSPIIQIKGFGLSVINTLINIGRFVLQMQATNHMKLLHAPQVHHVSSSLTHDMGQEEQWSSSNQYAYYAPPPHKVWGSARQGFDQPSGSFHAEPDVRETLPHTRANYVSGGYEERVYPYYNPNITRFR